MKNMSRTKSRCAMVGLCQAYLKCPVDLAVQTGNELMNFYFNSNFACRSFTVWYSSVAQHPGPCAYTASGGSFFSKFITK